MQVIGLTGGICSGKTMVSRFLAGAGAVVIDSDRLGHEALADDGVRQELVAVFGKQILAPDGSVDRKKLGALVFSNPEALGKLNGIVHPRMFEMLRAQLADYRRRGVKVVVLEAPLLIEAGLVPLVDEVWVTSASEATVIGRLKERGLSQAESRKRLRSQMPDEERVKFAAAVIDTDCPLEEMPAKLKALLLRVFPWL